MVDAVCPVGLVCKLALEGFHLQCLDALLAGAYVYAVAATETVEHVDSLDEAHTLERRAEGRDSAGLAHGRAFDFVFVEHEGADSCVGAYVCTLVTLYTVFFEPFGHECGNTAFFVCGSALFPCAVGVGGKRAHVEQVAILGVDRTHDIVDEGGVVVVNLGVVG